MTINEYNNIIKGKLKLKGKGLNEKSSKKIKRKRNKNNDSKKSKKEKKSKDIENEDSKTEEEIIIINDLTEAQKKHLKHKATREAEQLKKVASKTYRERVEEYNQYLAGLTEHHDIPRISAAGNG